MLTKLHMPVDMLKHTGVYTYRIIQVNYSLFVAIVSIVKDIADTDNTLTEDILTMKNKGQETQSDKLWTTYFIRI